LISDNNSPIVPERVKESSVADIQHIPQYDDAQDSNFFFFFLLVIGFLILGYVTYHNKNKVSLQNDHFYMTIKLLIILDIGIACGRSSIK
jgi:hypothetical protein